MKPSFLSELGAKVGNKAGTGGFKIDNSGQSGHGGYGRVVSARLGRTPSGVGGSTAKDESPSGGGNKWNDVEFFYMNVNDEQIGPATLKEMRLKWKSGELAGDCFYWFEGMGGWEALESNPPLLKQVNPPAPPKKPKSSGEIWRGAKRRVS